MFVLLFQDFMKREPFFFNLTAFEARLLSPMVEYEVIVVNTTSSCMHVPKSAQQIFFNTTLMDLLCPVKTRSEFAEVEVMINVQSITFTAC